MGGARHGLLATGLGLAALAVLGFGLGLLAGGLWREPSLVLQHLLGGSVEVAWSASRAPEPEPVAPPPAAAASPTAPPAVAAAPPARSGFAIQVGAFAESEPARQLAEALRGKGYAVQVTPGAAAGQARWRVRVGPFASRPEAERSAARLKSGEKLPTWILSEDEG